MTFEEIVAQFDQTSPQAVEEKLAAGQDLLLFVGRATCPYCQRFAPKLARVAQEDALSVSFIQSDQLADQVAITALRDRYQMKTVPALLVAKSGQVKVVCDSSLSEEAIRQFIA
ncbi:conjugal transfer protein TraF [Streptococcus cuniculipharyngis]|uniref:Thiol reductase thioredoxin n=1 Tax=Streptococcus cuniculipharyngis TaxID=1562651 RepID=A0A5C5SAQ2_9STRE|nr:conjugal transfer protein TraF [Streptococcus cuniculipharyngis]TWS96452.1 thiol reductase thioredoxin [Streptococcus cuniculipharyngis]